MGESAVLARAVLVDAFNRVAEMLPMGLTELTPEQMLWRPDEASNSIGWLAWHLTRVQDDHLAGVGGVEQVWLTQGWADRFDLPYPAKSIGYGQTADDVAAFHVTDAELLLGYFTATQAMTVAVLESMSAADFERVVDDRWDPPVTASVRIVSVVNDVTQHLGQIGYLRGLVERHSAAEMIRP